MTTSNRTTVLRPWKRITRTDWLTLAGVLAVHLLLVMVVVLAGSPPGSRHRSPCG